MKPELMEKYTRYEIARILGARSLQLAMDAPVLLKLSKEEIDELNYDVLKIAEKELDAEVLPITVKRPLPKKSDREIKKLSDEEVKEKLELKAEKEKKELDKLEEKKQELEKTEEKEIMESGEIMEIANPKDEGDVEEEKVVKEV
ncbi:MAG TPA: DNA-directed RNA polymerase subunit K [Candidatus Pacearchaeota archaeon]|jgi:DNA-directed RNA polymerase subunit K|nr:DNA-directed RNA polymerase subunit K [Candidatus Pacearchaeota archaeon]